MYALLHRQQTVNVWASEQWTDEDIIHHLEDMEITPTRETVRIAREYLIGLFDDKTDRNETIRRALESNKNLFYQGKRDSNSSELEQYLYEQGVDLIVDDEEFVAAEYAAVQDYCHQKGFNLSDGDLAAIQSRGLTESLENWKEFDA